MTEYQTVTGTETVIRDGTIKLHGPAGFEGMRNAGRLAAETDRHPEVRPYQGLLSAVGGVDGGLAEVVDRTGALLRIM